jgi:4,5-DOPA dioxygenase extradiol
MTGSLPAFFFGHGNPMHALLENAYSRGWAAIGKEIRGPPPSFPSLPIGTSRDFR